MTNQPRPHVSLRRTEPPDVPFMYGMGIDEASNRLAGTKPREWAEFKARWEAILGDADGTVTRVTPRIILADGKPVGSINIFPQDDLDHVGYWIAREHWGFGIASAALSLLLTEYRKRPLHATTAGHNQASIRVLVKHGFEIVTRSMTPETDRNVARETLSFVLRAGAGLSAADRNPSA